MARNLRSPETKARDALALANRKVDRITARQAKMVAEATELNGELNAAKVVRDYVAKNPALHMDPLVDAEILDDDGTLGDQAESSEPDTADETLSR